MTRWQRLHRLLASDNWQDYALAALLRDADADAPLAPAVERRPPAPSGRMGGLDGLDPERRQAAVLALVDAASGKERWRAQLRLSKDDDDGGA